MSGQHTSGSLQHPELVSDVTEAMKNAEEQESIEFEIGDELIDEQLAKYKDNRVSDTNAVKHVSKAILKEADIDNPRRFLSGGGRRSTGTVPSVTIDEIGDHLFWFDLDVEGVTVIDTYTPESEKKIQTGYIADSAGSIQYTLWDGAGIDPLTVGEDYMVSNVSVNEYRGELEINIGDDSTVEHTDDGPEIDPEAFVDGFEGCIVGFHDPTGLISRCQNPDCGRSLEYGTTECVECGSTEIEPELLAKAILDTGEDTVTAYFYRDQVSDLIKKSLEQCIDAAEEQGIGVVRNQIEANLHGTFISVKGSKRRQNFYVDDFEYVSAPTADTIETLADELYAVGEFQQ